MDFIYLLRVNNINVNEIFEKGVIRKITTRSKFEDDSEEYLSRKNGVQLTVFPNPNTFTPI